jgi:hypothetical protein
MRNLPPSERGRLCGESHGEGKVRPRRFAVTPGGVSLGKGYRHVRFLGRNSMPLCSVKKHTQGAGSFSVSVTWAGWTPRSLYEFIRTGEDEIGKSLIGSSQGGPSYEQFPNFVFSPDESPRIAR